jgi:hypothetical protein
MKKCSYSLKECIYFKFISYLSGVKEMVFTWYISKNINNIISIN